MMVSFVQSNKEIPTPLLLMKHLLFSTLLNNHLREQRLQRTGKALVLYESKQGLFLKKGLRRIYLPDSVNKETFTAEEAATYLS